MEELQEMREQLSILKEKLDNEQIVNDRLLREVTRQKVNRLNRIVWQEGAACAFVITFGSYVFYKLGCTWWFIGATILMMVVCFFATLIPHRRVKMDEIMQGDLLTVVKQVKQLKKIYHDWLKIGFPMIFVWLAWFGYDIWHTNNDMVLTIATMSGCFIGGVIGGVIGLIKHKRLTREMDEIINDIEH